MAELIINTNEVVIKEGILKKDTVRSKNEATNENTVLLQEINHKLDLLLRKEDKHGETND